MMVCVNVPNVGWRQAKHFTMKNEFFLVEQELRDKISQNTIRDDSTIQKFTDRKLSSC